MVFSIECLHEVTSLFERTRTKSLHVMINLLRDAGLIFVQLEDVARM